LGLANHGVAITVKTVSNSSYREQQVRQRNRNKRLTQGRLNVFADGWWLTADG
jgi:hypothetical protein